MKITHQVPAPGAARVWGAIGGLALLGLSGPNGWAQGTAFTYQGRLSNGNGGVNGIYDFRFAAYDAAGGGAQVGATVNTNGVGVTNGLFTVTLDFGVNVFTGTPRFLDLAAKTNASPAAFVSMTPRQLLTPAPYAIYAANANTVANGAVGNAQLTANAVQQTNLIVSGSPGPGKVISSDGSGLVWADAPTIGGVWGTTGNGGTTPGVNFIGTTDNKPLEIKASGVRALRIEGNNISAFALGQGFADANLAPNLIAGSPYNQINSDVVGSSILGGGAGNFLGQVQSNSVAANFSTIAGGTRNAIQSASGSDFDNFIGGGEANVISGNNSGALIGGGFHGLIRSNSSYSSIVGGANNSITGQGSFIGGGGLISLANGVGYQSAPNLVLAGSAVLVGGANNRINAGGDFSFIGGGSGNTVTGTNAVVVGGHNNQAAGSGAVTGGGDQNTNNGYLGVIAGGQLNVVVSNVFQPSIGGGFGNSANGQYATIPGGKNNTANGDYSFAAGFSAKAVNPGSFVWADSQGPDFGSTANDQFSIRARGGVRMLTSGAGLTVDGVPFGGTFCTNSGSYSIIGGGLFNSLAATSSYSTIAGGDGNLVESYAMASAIGGGALNRIQGDFSTWNINALTAGTIGGGYANQIGTNADLATIAGGGRNTNNSVGGVIGGGRENYLGTGAYATVPGGFQNSASGNYSFSAGRQAAANHNGAFVWADSQGGYFASTNNDSFNVRAQGGARFVTGGAGLTVDGVPVLTGAINGLASLTGNQTFSGANVFSNSLVIGTTAGQLTLQGESGIAVGIAGTGGPNAGHVRFRNALEIFPAANNSANGYLDVRSTNAVEITLRADNGSITTSGDANIGGNLAARNTPGVNYHQSAGENIGITTTPQVICSEGNYKPATGFFIINAYISGNFNGNDVNLSLVDVSGPSPLVLTHANSSAALNGNGNGFSNLSLSWVVPISSAGGYQNFGLEAFTVGGGTGTIFSHNLTVLYVPRQNN